MVIFAYHPTLKKWTEVGNRALRPGRCRGLWGCQTTCALYVGSFVERPTMIKYNINNIRIAFGHKIDLNKNKSARAGWTVDGAGVNVCRHLCSNIAAPRFQVPRSI